MKPLNIKKMEQINRSKTKVHSQNRQGFDNSSTCQYRILISIPFKPGSPNSFSVLNEWKSPP